MKTTKILTLFLVVAIGFTACKKDQSEAELAKPTIENIEIGLNNSEIGIIGQDFHFNADVIAGDKIDMVEVKILQKVGGTYSAPWSLTVTWPQYKGAKNTNIHKHFDIPSAAVEGEYDFIITIMDENGTKTEEKRKIRIWTKENLPVFPGN
ncbi:DUF4625 domain-containing protein [Pedobacter sp. MW01-1-1]|uniref:DUF4625 domain-containing protein n=1 Tax=Pedobacter sp. MW01-1-1 TaxID=3383027 RepID=UPI003FF0D986